MKKKISSFINQLLKEADMTQRDLAKQLEISPGSLSAYIKGKELPRVDVIVKLAEIGGVSLDDLLKGKKQPEIKVSISGEGHIAPVAGRDMYFNATKKQIVTYAYEKGHLLPAQAQRLQELVNEIVSIEKTVKKKPKSHAAVWNAVRRKFKVGFYREIQEERFPEAELYLQQWIGRIKRGLKRKAPGEWRNSKYKYIYAASKNNLGWTKKQLSDYVYGEYGKVSLRELNKKELEQLYNKITALKRTK